MELVCIVCPRGCRINIENGVVSGNGCKRGEAFAVSETTCPMRSVCSTVATTFKDYPVLPVRTDGEIPKDKIDELMKQINAVVVSEKLHRGDVVLKGVCGTDVNLIATASIY